MKERGRPKTFVKGFHDEFSLMTKLQYKPLGKTGLELSHLALGGATIGGSYGERDDIESIKVVTTALKRGINYIDTSPWYGQGKSEQVIGKALKGIPREAYYIGTKVGRYDLNPQRMFNFTAEHILKGLDESLRYLGLDYVDLIQVHDAEFASNIDIILNETLPALQKAKEEGKARFIGVTGYPVSLLKEIVERSSVKIDTVLSYSRCTMNDSTLLSYLDFFLSRGVGVINASPLSMGLMTHAGPPKWHPASEKVKEACRSAASYCESKGMNISRLAARYSIRHPEITTNLSGAGSMMELERTLQSVENPLTSDEQECLNEVLGKFMKPLNNGHWEGTEVGQYRAKLSNGNPK